MEANQLTAKQMDSIGQHADVITDEILQLLVQELHMDFDGIVKRPGLEAPQQQQVIEGIETNLFAIERYVVEVYEEIESRCPKL